MAAAKKTVKKNAALVKATDTSLANLEAAAADAAKALAAATKKSKQSSAEGKRLSKKRVALIKRNKTAAEKAKKNPIAENKKALAAVAKELTAVRKEAAKNKIVRAADYAELSGLRMTNRRLAAYGKVLATADKVLNKPKKKVRRRRKA
ncbi:MAG: hypothetical protein HND53_12735 [Proteobacteria bacterium]|nr:hypothetical protein [Pseudomonadota bacterium]